MELLNNNIKKDETKKVAERWYSKVNTDRPQENAQEVIISFKKAVVDMTHDETQEDIEKIKSQITRLHKHLAHLEHSLINDD